MDHRVTSYGQGYLELHLMSSKFLIQGKEFYSTLTFNSIGVNRLLQSLNRFSKWSFIQHHWNANIILKTRLISPLWIFSSSSRFPTSWSYLFVCQYIMYPMTKNYPNMKIYRYLQASTRNAVIAMTAQTHSEE